jgi:hypothetical protein
MRDNELTKDQWLARCANVYDMGLVTWDQLLLMERWLDFVMRFEHTMFSHGQSQGDMCWRFLDEERQRIQENNRFTLASDKQGYDIIRLAAVFSHGCQQCAEDPKAWHTRACFEKNHESRKFASSLSVEEETTQKRKNSDAI